MTFLKPCKSASNSKTDHDVRIVLVRLYWKVYHQVKREAKAEQLALFCSHHFLTPNFIPLPILASYLPLFRSYLERGTQNIFRLTKKYIINKSIHGLLIYGSMSGGF